MKRKNAGLAGLAVIMAIALALAAAPAAPAFAASTRTQAEAVQWVKGMAGGQAVDYDGSYAAQCVDFIRVYYQHLGVSGGGGNASAYVSNKLPSGFTRIKYSSGFVAQPGDIAVWSKGYSGSTLGHVAVIISANASKMTVVDQFGSSSKPGTHYNAKTHKTITLKGLVVNKAHSMSYAKYGQSVFWGVIRPAFSNTAVVYQDIAEGDYRFVNAAQSLNATSDKDGGNVSAAASNEGSSAQVWSVAKSGASYRVTSALSPSGRVLNVYTSGSSAAGQNVTLWQVTNHATQLWKFEAKGDAYVIHPSDNTGAALTAAGGDVKLAASTGAAGQLWSLQPVVSEAAIVAEGLEADAEDILEPDPDYTAVAQDDSPAGGAVAPGGDPAGEPSGNGGATGDPTGGQNGDPTGDPTGGTAAPGGGGAPASVNGIELSAVVTELGVKLSWAPSGNALGYRIFRGASAGDEGISITDFPLSTKEYVDVNVEPDTSYWYAIAAVEAEASFDAATMELTPERIGPRGSAVEAVTAVIVPAPPAKKKHFILMKIDDPKMLVDEAYQEIDPGRGTSPMLLNERTMVPIRAIIESMGGEVGWEGATSTVSLDTGEYSVSMRIGNKSITANGAAKEMDVAPEIINERTMLPLRFVAENTGCEIAWIGATREIIIVFYTQPVGE
jgi:hypothetical protein